MNILKSIKRHLGISRIIFLIGATIGFFALYLNVRVLAYISIVFCTNCVMDFSYYLASSLPI